MIFSVLHANNDGQLTIPSRHLLLKGVQSVSGYAVKIAWCTASKTQGCRTSRRHVMPTPHHHASTCLLTPLKAPTLRCGVTSCAVHFTSPVCHRAAAISHPSWGPLVTLAWKAKSRLQQLTKNKVYGSQWPGPAFQLLCRQPILNNGWNWENEIYQPALYNHSLITGITKELQLMLWWKCDTDFVLAIHSGCVSKSYV